jgi:ribonuclease VapC
MTAKVLQTLAAAVVDSSPIMSIFEKRSSAQAFLQGLAKSSKLFMSAGTLMELSVIFIGKKSVAGTQPLDDLLEKFKIEIMPLDRPMVGHGRDGCANYGKGHHSADLNMGDLFSYALAKSMDLPLYFEGLDFPQTDIKDAMSMLGYAFDAKHSPITPPTQAT